MKSILTMMLFTSVIMVSHQTFSVAQEGRSQEEILKTTPVSDAIPVEIKTVRQVIVDNVKTESQSITKGMRRKYGYDLAPSPNPHEFMLANV